MPRNGLLNLVTGVISLFFVELFHPASCLVGTKLVLSESMLVTQNRTQKNRPHPLPSCGKFGVEKY